MKKYKLEVFLLMGLLSFLFSCGNSSLGEKGSNGEGKKAKDNESGIVSFEYYYNGSIGANSYSYKVNVIDGKLLFTYNAMQNSEFGDMQIECGQDVLDRLYKLYKDLRIAEWNGYDKYNPNVLDGDGFSVWIQFGDNAVLRASGSNACPVRYSDFMTGMSDILIPLRDTVLEEKRQEFIDKGINGKLNSVMVHFIQHGTSGRDEYDIFLIDEKYRENNCEIKYRSVSGEYLPKGEKHCYVNLPLADAGLDEMQKIIEDYNILSWYDYDKAAEDYNNSEWFQISFGFDDDLRIDACGTLHPENYDEFRAAFLKWFVPIVEKYCE